MILSFILCFIWRRSKTYPGFGLWVTANFMVAAGFFMVSLRDVIPDFFTIIVGNTLITGSFLLATEGSRKFLRLADNKIFSLGFFAVFSALLFYFTYSANNAVIFRIILASLSVALLCGGNAFVYVRRFKQKNNFTYKFAAGFYVFLGLALILRSILTLKFSHLESLYTPDWIQSVFFLTFIIFSIAMTFVYIILNEERLQQKLKIAQSNLEKMATTDFLTGIYNNRYFFETGTKELQRAKRFNNSLAVIMIDIDHFKYFNDTFGHAAGDRVLTEIARICQNTLRNIDILARLGGEEFAVILPSTSADNAETVAENLRLAIAAAKLEFLSEKIKITASFGIAGLTAEDRHIESILRRADAALYEAKRAGRNRVISGASEPVDFTKLAAA